MLNQAPNKISKDTEKQLIGHLDKVAGFIKSGSTPNEAIVKVAREHDVELGHVKLLAQAYNNARTNQQRKSSDKMEEKIASFSLADVKEITNELYPSEIKTAAAIAHEEVVDEEYARPPVLKVASTKHGRFIKLANETPRPTYTHEPGKNTKKAHSLLKELNRDFEEKRRIVSETRDKVATAYNDLMYYFKQAYRPVNYKEASVNATALWGKSADILLKHVLEDMPQLKKEASYQHRAIDRNKEPFNLVAKCLTKVAEYNAAKEDFREFSKQADVASERLVAPFLPYRPTPVYGSIVKKALDDEGMFDSVVGNESVKGIQQLSGLSSLTDSITKGKGLPDNKLKTNAFMSVTDPNHEAKLRALRSQASLTDMMANDPFLSGESPDHVVGLYNQITKLSPRTADQPLLMRAMLRRYLAQGQVDPHDIDQLAGIELKLKQRDEPTREYNLPTLPGDFSQREQPKRREEQQ